MIFFPVKKLLSCFRFSVIIGVPFKNKLQICGLGTSGCNIIFLFVDYCAVFHLLVGGKLSYGMFQGAKGKKTSSF